MTTAQRVARNSAVQLAGRAVTLCVSLATLGIASRYLGPDRFGDYQTVLAFLLLANLSDFGVSTIAVRHLSTLDRRPDEVLANVLAVRLVFACASAAIAIASCAALGYDGDIVAAVAVGAVSYPLLAMAGTYGAWFAAELRMQYATAGNVAQAAVTLGAAALVAGAGDGIVEMTAAYTAGVLANCLVCLWFARTGIAMRLAWEGAYARRVLREALPLGLAVVVITAYGRLDILLLGWMTDHATVGQYGFAYRVVDLAFPLSFFFVGSIFPLLSSAHAAGDGARFSEIYRRGIDVLALSGIALVTAIVLFAGPVTDIVGGDDYDAAATAMRILALAILLIWISNLADHALIAAGRQSALLWIALGGLAVNLAANLVLIPAYEQNGAAAATVITEAAVLAPALLLVERYAGASPAWLVAARMLPVAALAAAVTLLLPLHWAFEAPLAGAVFLAGVAAARVVSADDVREILGRGARGRDLRLEAP